MLSQRHGAQLGESNELALMGEFDVPNLAAAPGLDWCCVCFDDAGGDRFDEVGVVIDTDHDLTGLHHARDGANGFSN